MERPGEYIKRERELREVTLESVHEATRVPMKFLVALEADNHEVLPHPAFVKGFMKSYAKYLGLDETEVVLRYEMYLRENSQQEEPAPYKEWGGAPKDAAALKGSRVVQILVAVGVVVIVIFYLFSSRKGVNEALAPVASVNEAPTSAIRVESIPGEGGGLKTAAAAGDWQSVQPQPAIDEHSLSVQAKEVTWIEVAIDGKEPFDVLLKEGERIVWKASREFFLVIGNAGGVELKFDGEDLQLYGESGRVVRLRLPPEDAPVEAPPVANMTAGTEADTQAVQSDL
jgi:hypothetical protein